MCECLFSYIYSIWSPYLKIDISLIERVQISFAKQIPTIRNLSYSDRLTYLNINFNTADYIVTLFYCTEFCTAFLRMINFQAEFVAPQWLA